MSERKPQRLAGPAERVRALIAADPDLAIDGLHRRFADEGVTVSRPAMGRSLKRHLERAGTAIGAAASYTITGDVTRNNAVKGWEATCANRRSLTSQMLFRGQRLGSGSRLSA